MRVLAEYEAGKFLSRYIPVAKSFLCPNSTDVVKCTKKLKFPVALKLAGVLHKTDIGGVKIAKNFLELRNGYTELMRTSRDRKIKSKGILAQEFVRGREIIVGIKSDATFGHAVMLGIGGIHTELMKDVSFRVCPITEKDAQEMVDELKMGALLKGFRGEKAVNMKLLKSVLVKASKIPLKYKNMKEMDINPFIINNKTGKAVDARIVLG